MYDETDVTIKILCLATEKVMIRKKLALGMLLTVFCLQAQEIPDNISSEISDLKPFDPLFDDPALNRFLNPDENEQAYVYSIEQPPPPGKLLVWLRIIGTPLINAFFSVRRVVRESIAWILAKIKYDQEVQTHAQK